LKNQEKSDFNLEQVVSQSYGFDLLMRHMSDQWCHENLGAFYDIECYQWLIIQDLRQEEYVNIKGCHLLGFSKELPKSWIIRRPIAVEIRFENGRKKYDIVEQDEKQKKKETEKQEKSEKIIKNQPLVEYLRLSQGGSEAIRKESTKKDKEPKEEEEKKKEKDDDEEDENDKKIHPAQNQLEYDKKVVEYKTRAHYIFEKYIRVNARHEINISGPLREDYHALFQNREAWIYNMDHHTKHKLLHVFDKVKLEINRLLVFGFQHFRTSSRYGMFVAKVHEKEVGGIP